MIKSNIVSIVSLKSNYNDVGKLRRHFFRLSSGLAYVTSCLDHIVAPHTEVTNKINEIRVIGIKSRSKELNKIKEASSVVEDKE